MYKPSLNLDISFFAYLEIWLHTWKLCTAGMSIWLYGAEMSATGIFLAPVRKKPAPEIRLGSARPASSVGKACPAYFERVLVKRRRVRVVAKHYNYYSTCTIIIILT